MPFKRQEFTDAQKAEISARDRAISGYSGVSLWLADFGAAPAQIDWVDHIHAAAKGGSALAENGACASFLYNWVQREQGRSVLLLFAGRPPVDHHTLFGVVTPDISVHLKRFSALHSPDRYANRALFQWSFFAVMSVSCVGVVCC